MAPEPLEEVVKSIDTRVKDIDTHVKNIDTHVKNIDSRLTHVEQILPTLATKTELHDAKNELRDAIATAVAPLATKAELREAIADAEAEIRLEIREGNEQTRRHFDVVAEHLGSQIQLLAEGQDMHRESNDRRFMQMERLIAQHDRRLMRLEAKQPKRNA